MPIRIEMIVDIPKEPLFTKGGAAAIIQLELQKFIRLSLLRGLSEAQKVTPIGGTGNLIGNLVTKVAKGTKVEYAGDLIWKSPYANIVDKGGPARHVPEGPLTLWASVVLGTVDPEDIEAIQRAIARYGTPSPTNTRSGLGMSDRVETAWTPQVESLLQTAADIIASRL